MIWNKNAFTEVGLDPEVPPETWDDLWEYTDQLDVQNEDGTYARIGFFPLWNAGVDFWARTNGWEPVVDGVPNINDPAYIETNVELANWSGGFALSIPSGAENPDAAWEFIKCMAGPIGQASWSRDTFAIPTNEEAATQPELMADPYWPTIIELMEHSQGSDYVPEYPNWTEQVNPRHEQVWTGELTPQAMAEEAQQAIDEQIEANQ